jgi:predicted ATPase
LRDLLARDDVRLLVLSGAGGSGKTRLALDAALRSASKFANGVAFVALAPLRDPALVVGAIARALGLEEQIGDPLARLAAFLRPLELLLVVDNAEHLRAAAPAFVELLAGAPRLKVLITSRVVLHLSGEHVYPVGPLDERAAVELFCARARAAEASFVLDESNRQVIERICQRLDGLPLAIELAASRARILTPAELLPRLEPRLPLLIGGPRDLPARQQTMRATIAWSHELLDEDEQRDFRRLAIFAGGCTPQAAEAICGSVFERLWALADHNLLRRVVSAGGSRFQMLETVREYAAERLEGSGELDQTSRRHAGFYLALAEAANLHADAEGPQDFDTVHVEQDNLHAAIAWALGAGEIELALGLTVALENFWVTHDPGEGMRLFGLALESGATFPPELRARALRALGGSTQVAGNPERAMRLYEQSRELFHSLGDKKGTAVLDYRLGRNALELGDLTRAQALLSASLEAFRAAGSRRGEAQAVGSLGELARSQGERELAAGLFEQSAAMCERIGRKWWQARMLANLADLALEQGRIKDAANRGRELLPLAQRIGDRQGVLHALACLACVAADDGRAEHAGRLWGALEAEHARHPVAAWSRDRERYATWLLAQPHHDLQNGIQEGRLLALQTAVEEALADDTVSAPPAASRG